MSSNNVWHTLKIKNKFKQEFQKANENSFKVEMEVSILLPKSNWIYKYQYHGFRNEKYQINTCINFYITLPDDHKFSSLKPSSPIISQYIAQNSRCNSAQLVLCPSFSRWKSRYQQDCAHLGGSEDETLSDLIPVVGLIQFLML